MQTAILIANIGVRDLGKEGNPLFFPGNSSFQRNVYNESKELLRSKKFDDLELLLLEPVIDKIKTEFTLQEIILFGTTQNKSNKQHSKDTIFISHIAKKIICDRYLITKDKIKIKKIKKNPADYIEVAKSYKDEFKKLANRTDKVFVSVTGGTPQQNAAIIIETLSIFGERALMIYKPEGINTPIEYDIGSYTRSLVKKTLPEESVSFFPLDEQEKESSILIANIGVRDLGKKGIPLFDISDEYIFEKSKKILKNKKFEDLELIFLDPVIKKINSSFHLEKIILFGTKQIKPHPKDTIHITSIVKSILSSKYGINEQYVIINEVSKNPTDYIEMLINYHDEIGKISSNMKKVFVSTTAGTPQQKFAIMFESIFRFNKNVVLFYKPQDLNEIVEYKIKEQLNSAKIEIENGNYKKATYFLDNAKKSAQSAELQKVLYEIFNLKLTLSEDISEQNPEDSFLKAQISGTLGDFGILLINMNLVEEAKKTYEKEISILQNLLEKDPENKDYLVLIGSAYYNLGHLLFESGLIEEATQKYECALTFYIQLIEKYPGNEDYLTIIGSIYCMLGQLLSESGFIEKATQRYECALKFHNQLIEKYPKNKHYYSSVLKNALNLIQLYFDCAEGEENSQMKMAFFEKVILNCEYYQDYFIKDDFEYERKLLLRHRINSQRKFSSIHIEMQKNPDLSAEKCDEAIKKIKKIKNEVRDKELEELCLSAIHCFQDKKRIFQGKKLTVSIKDLQSRHYRSFVLKDILNFIQLRLNCAKNEEDTFSKMTSFMKVIYTCEQYQTFFIKNNFEYERKFLFEAKINSQTEFYRNDIKMQNEYDLKAKKCDEAIKKIQKIKEEVNDGELEKQCLSSIHYFQEYKLLYQGQKLICEAAAFKPPNVDLIKQAIKVFENIKDTNREAEKYFFIYTGYVKIENLLSNKRRFGYNYIDENQDDFLRFFEEHSHKLDNEILCVYKNISILLGCSDKTMQGKLVKLDRSIDDVNNNELKTLFKHLYQELLKGLSEILSFNVKYNEWELTITINNPEKINGKVTVKSEDGIIDIRNTADSEIIISYEPQKKKELITLSYDGREASEKIDYHESIDENKQVYILKRNCKEHIFAKHPYINIAIVQLKYEVTDHDRIIEVTKNDKYHKKIFLILDTLSNYELDFVVFPEFSIPFEYLHEIKEFTDKTGINVIAGTHYITDVSGYKNLFNYEFTTDDKYKNICPVVIPDSKLFHVEKTLPAKVERPLFSEERMTYGNISSIFELKNITFGILICYECLNSKLRRRLAEKCNVIFIPQTNPKPEEFYSKLNSDIKDPSLGHIVYIMASGIFSYCGELFGGCSGVTLTLDRSLSKKKTSEIISPINGIKEQCVLLASINMDYDPVRDNHKAQRPIETSFIYIFEDEDISNCSNKKSQKNIERINAQTFWEIMKEIKTSGNPEKIKDLLVSHQELLADYSPLMYKRIKELHKMEPSKIIKEFTPILISND